MGPDGGCPAQTTETSVGAGAEPGGIPAGCPSAHHSAPNENTDELIKQAARPVHLALQPWSPVLSPAARSDRTGRPKAKALPARGRGPHYSRDSSSIHHDAGESHHLL
jgi:hypothetical protein